jgi:hypothetical protein
MCVNSMKKYFLFLVFFFSFFIVDICFGGPRKQRDQQRMTRALNFRQNSGWQSMMFDDDDGYDEDEVTISHLIKLKADAGKELTELMKRLGNDKKDTIDAQIRKIQQNIDEYDAKITEKQNQSKTYTDALTQGISRGLTGRKCSSSQDLPLILTQAMAERFFNPINDVVTEKSTTFWQYFFDGLENKVSATMQFFGFQPTVSDFDVSRWQKKCAEIADNYKELRKGIETSESRSTSMQLRSLLIDVDGEQEKEVKQSIADVQWLKKRKGDLIFFRSLLETAKIRLDEVGNERELETALFILIAELEGMIEQLEGIACLQDIIDPTRTHLMNSYFLSLDSALGDLESLIAPDKYEKKDIKRKKQGGYSGYNYGYDD